MGSNRELYDSARANTTHRPMPGGLPASTLAKGGGKGQPTRPTAPDRPGVPKSDPCHAVAFGKGRQAGSGCEIDGRRGRLSRSIYASSPECRHENLSGWWRDPWRAHFSGEYHLATGGNLMARRSIVTGCSLQGYRSENEDLVIIEDGSPWNVCLVLDGIGGKGLGIGASREAGAVIARALRERLPRVSTPELVSSCLRTAIMKAHEALAVANNQRPGGVPSGCTVAVAAVSARDGVAILAHVGQPFAFCVRGSVALRLFRNHPTETVEEGRKRGLWIDPLFPLLGIPEHDPEVVGLAVTVDPGDFLAVCSDGIEVLNLEQIAASLLDRVSAEPPAERLCRLALAKGCRDNVTVAVVEVR